MTFHSNAIAGGDYDYRQRYHDHPRDHGDTGHEYRQCVDDKGHIVGILCQSDLIAQQKKLPIPTLFTFLDSVIQLNSAKQIEKQIHKIAALTVAEAMTPEPVVVHPDTGVETVAALMVDNNFHTLPVVENSRLVGIIGKEDVLRTLLPNFQGN
jgi:CBS-domain-containing membrane protein